MNTSAGNAAVRFHLPGSLAGALAIFLSGIAPANSAADFSESARALKAQLSGQIMPYWFDTAQDKEHGGDVLCDDHEKHAGETGKQLGSHDRVVCGGAASPPN